MVRLGQAATCPSTFTTHCERNLKSNAPHPLPDSDHASIGLRPAPLLQHYLDCQPDRFILLLPPLLQIIVSTFEEDLPKHHFDNAAEYAVETARHKAMDVARLCAAQAQAGKPPVDLIISADTVSSCYCCCYSWCHICKSQLGSTTQS
jgi:hypothetical protein